MSVQPGTPLPWAHETGPALKGKYHTIEANDREHMVCELYEGSERRRVKDARYIVTACNSFPELVAALEASNIALEEAANLLAGRGMSGVAGIMRGYIERNSKALSALEVGGGNRG